MANAQDFVKLAVDAHRGIGDAAKYSKSEVQGALRDFLVEQFGSTKLDARALRNCDPKTFALVEEVIQKELNDYWTNNEIVNRIVEYRNLALGDEQEFYVQEDELLAVASIAEGSTHIRRQRFDAAVGLFILCLLLSLAFFLSAAMHLFCVCVLCVPCTEHPFFAF